MPPWDIADVPYISYLLSGLSWKTYFIHVRFSFDCEKQTYGMHFYWEWKHSSTAKLAAAHYSTRLLKNRRRDLIGCLFDNDLRWPLWKCADCENHCCQHEASIASLQQSSYSIWSIVLHHKLTQPLHTVYAFGQTWIENATSLVCRGVKLQSGNFSSGSEFIIFGNHQKQKLFLLMTVWICIILISHSVLHPWYTQYCI